VKEAWQQTGSAVTTPTAGETLAGTGISYAYDGIGNRLTHTEGGRGTSTVSTDPNGVASSTVTLQDQRIHNYTPNAANQYTQITHPAFFNVKGTRTAGATIAVNGVAIATPTATATAGYQTGGTGTIFRAEVPNTAPAGFTGGTVDLYQPVTITQNGTQLTVDDPVQYVPPPTETLTYDADGNLKTDGRWTYTWDAADRLIKMESIAFVQNAVTTPPLLPAVNVPAKVIEFDYDGLSRRIRKKVTEGVSTIAVWEAYVYDGWNMVLSVKPNPAAGATQGRPQSAIASNVWAPDLGSLPFARQDWQAAGGVRGLVLANYFTGANGGGLHVPGMDPMGNVTSVTRLGMSYSAGESPGPYFRSEFVYDYDAFGKETRSSTLVAGLNPDSFPFHFSTKFTDPESGFNYYGYRFYDPANGRWINRDPIEEEGGVNLYGFAINNGIDYWDILGKHRNRGRGGKQRVTGDDPKSKGTPTDEKGNGERNKKKRGNQPKPEKTCPAPQQSETSDDKKAREQREEAEKQAKEHQDRNPEGTGQPPPLKNDTTNPSSGWPPPEPGPGTRPGMVPGKNICTGGCGDGSRGTGTTPPTAEQVVKGALVGAGVAAGAVAASVGSPVTVPLAVGGLILAH